jgi:hypothetical protein
VKLGTQSGFFMGLKFVLGLFSVFQLFVSHDAVSMGVFAAEGR